MPCAVLLEAGGVGHEDRRRGPRRRTGDPSNPRRPAKCARPPRNGRSPRARTGDLLFGSEWLEERRGDLRERTVDDYTWRLTHHLLPFFARHRLGQLTIVEVDRYRQAKVREGRLGANAINKTIDLLGQLLDVAEERELIARNPVRVNPRRRKLRATTPERSYLDHAAHIAALLDAGDELDREAARADRAPGSRRAVLATLIFTGLRVEELCELRWRDVDFAEGRLRVAHSKTDAGVRHVDLLPVLRDELVEHRARAGRVSRDSYVFKTATGNRRDRNNVNRRVVQRARDLANERVLADGGGELPRLTPHALRRTFASILVARGDDLAYVLDQVGHTDAKLTLKLYAKKDPPAERDAMRRLVDGEDRAPTGTTPAFPAERAA